MTITWRRKRGGSGTCLADPAAARLLQSLVPEFLQSPTQFAGGDKQRGLAAYQEAGQEWQQSQALEKGLA